MSNYPRIIPPRSAVETHVAARLSTRDPFLPLWIGLAMAAGLLLGRLIPGLASGLDAVSIRATSLPIGIGLLLMMYPVLAKVCYREIGRITADRRVITASLILNWIIGPAVMFAPVAAPVYRRRRCQDAAHRVCSFAYRRSLVTRDQSIAAPAVMIGRVFSDVFAGIASGSALGLSAAQILDALLVRSLVVVLYRNAGATADDVVAPHHNSSPLVNAGVDQRSSL